MTILLVEQSTQRVLDISDQVCVLGSGRAVWRGEAAEARDYPALIEERRIHDVAFDNFEAGVFNLPS
jgi:ABC-type branched-subunit amino acid transport system ATPase component